MTAPELITAREAADALSVPYTTFIRWVNDGHVQPDFHGKERYLFHPQSVEDLRGVLVHIGREPILAGELAA
jgi:predicted site-specific integrase-resolvase